jgi:hypothetical protein
MPPQSPEGGSFHFGNKKLFMFLSVILVKEKFVVIKSKVKIQKNYA